MKSNKLFQNSAIVTAVLASLCCITPVLAVLGGLSGIASTFSFLEPLRPYFIAFTAIVLGYAFYNAYSKNPASRDKPKKQDDIECACEPARSTDGDEENPAKKNFINSKGFLWLVAIVSIVLISFPYYSEAFFTDSGNNIVVVQSDNIQKAEMEIEGMTCTGCEQSVNYALKSENGVVCASSSYKTGIANIEYDESNVTPEELKKIVEEKVGYKVKDFRKVVK
jgi:copper chaperone CopZ